jgi:hypothetical protein
MTGLSNGCEHQDMASAGRRAFRATGAAAVLLVSTLLAGCGGDSTYGARVFAVPHKFDWQSCKQLTAQRDSFTKRIDEVRTIMAKNARDPGGGFVNATAHQPTLVGFEAERRLIEESMEAKHCGSEAAAG